MSKLIVEAITEYYGERCPDFDAECFCCKVWSEYDVLTSPAPCDELVTVFTQWINGKEDQLVTRQNAEAVIAAKDARIAELEDHFNEMTRSCLAERDSNKTLEADNKRLREALEPFAEYGEDYFDRDNNNNPLPDEQGVGWIYMNFGHFRNARAALGEVKP